MLRPEFLQNNDYLMNASDIMDRAEFMDIDSYVFSIDILLFRSKYRLPYLADPCFVHENGTYLTVQDGIKAKSDPDYFLILSSRDCGI